MTRQNSDAALRIAQEILEGFNKHYRIFRQSSVLARTLFERKEWAELRAVNRARIDMYDTRAHETVDILKSEYQESSQDSIWPEIKKIYISLLYEHPQPELAETFFNTVAAKVLHRRYHNNQYIFTRPAVAAEHIEATQPTYRCYYPTRTGLKKTLMQIFTDFQFGVPLVNPRLNVRNLLEAFREWMPGPVKLDPNFHIQVLYSLFYRGKTAYAVGRMINGHRRELFAIALRHAPEGGLTVDALIHEREHLANLFSVAHAYFMVDMEVPSSWVSFINSALPEKPKAELYTAFGLQKQGKTLFFRDLNQHLKNSEDLFVVAPGVRGMVMYVFMLPSFPFVFKVIRDRFEPPKDTSHALVKAKYNLVKHHDRVGRLADTLEYAEVAFPVNRFDPQLIEEMKKFIPSQIEIDDTHLVVKHMYIEQRMTPLDIYIKGADEKRLRHGLDEFGQTLKDLAAANIFAGDLLPKNFGVNAYGRVLFYDYDEVCYLTECNFRYLPQASSDEDEMRSEPWYTVGPHDVFPEEFVTFLFAEEHARSLFREIHGDILDPGFWNEMKEKISSGTEPDVYAYPESMRFKNTDHQVELDTPADL